MIEKPPSPETLALLMGSPSTHPVAASFRQGFQHLGLLPADGVWQLRKLDATTTIASDRTGKNKPRLVTETGLVPIDLARIAPGSATLQ